THLSAIHYDDVAELAGEGTSARTLNDTLAVGFFQHVESRRRRVRKMDLFRLVVAVPVAASGVFAQKSRPGILGLAPEEDVAMAAAFLRQESCYRAADYYGLAACPETVCDLKNAHHLEEVAGNADDLGVIVKVYLLACTLVAYCHVVL